MRRPVVSLAFAAALAASSCALVDALLGPRLSTPEELCDEALRIWADCPIDRVACEQHVECLQEKIIGCDEDYADWVRCLQDSEPDCADAAAGAPLPCASEYRAYLTCLGDNSLSDGEGKILGCLQGNAECNNGVCEVLAGETPASCSSDCPVLCSVPDGGGPETGYCTAFRTDACSVCHCEVNQVCDPLTENDFFCRDCRCDQDGHCDAGESVFGCPGDCACDFDGACDGEETELSCPDCDPCDDATCASGEGFSCMDDPGCRVPFMCGSDGFCRLPCLPDGNCPDGFNCSSSLCVPN